MARQKNLVVATQHRNIPSLRIYISDERAYKKNLNWFRAWGKVRAEEMFDFSFTDTVIHRNEANRPAAEHPTQNIIVCVPNTRGSYI